MTDPLWGEIRSLLHANAIERSKAREIALALAEDMSEERAEQLLMLVDGLTHKRGDVIIDGEWVDTEVDIDGMTPEELDAAGVRLLRLSNRLNVLRGKTFQKLSDLSHQQWEAQRRAEQEQRLEMERRLESEIQSLSTAFAAVAPSAQHLSDALRRLAPPQVDPVELMIEQAARDAGFRLLDRSEVLPGPYLQIPDQPDSRRQAPPAPIRRFAPMPPTRLNWTLAPATYDEPDDDDDHDD